MQSGTAELNIKSADGAINSKTVGGMEADIKESLYAPAMYKINIASVDQDIWNKVVSNINDMKAAFRWGAIKDSGKIEWGETRNIQITKLKLINSGTFLSVNIEASDMSFYLQQTPQRVFKDKTITEMVTQIADENNLKSDIAITSNVKLGLVQAGMSDYEFISTVLAPRARLVLPVLCYIKNGDVLVFKERKKTSPAITYSWKGQTKDSVILTQVISVLTLNKSNFGTKGVTFDPLKRQICPYIFEVDANDSSVLQERQFSSATPPVSIGTSVAEIDSIVISNLENSPDRTIKERVSWDPSLGMFRVILPSELLPKAQIGTTVQVDTETAEGEKLFDTGVYLLYSVHHKIAPEGNVYTNAFLERRGTE